MNWGTTRTAPATPTGYASVLEPVFKYYSATLTVSATNNTITFGEGGADLTATVASGTWRWGDELCAKIKRALDAASDVAGNNSTFTVTYDHTTRKFTISKASGTFTLNHGGSANDLLDDIGFTGDKSGALTYTSDVAVPGQTTLTCTKRVRMPQVEAEVTREDTEHESGRKESVYQGEVVRYPFRLEFESVATAQGFWDMWDSCAKYGNEIEFYPDAADTTAYAIGYWDTKRPVIRELTDKSLFRLFDIEFPFRFKMPAPFGDSTLKPRDFFDRRPTS